jgi:hypothetical protein
MLGGAPDAALLLRPSKSRSSAEGAEGKGEDEDEDEDAAPRQASNVREARLKEAAHVEHTLRNVRRVLGDRNVTRSGLAHLGQQLVLDGQQRVLAGERAAKLALGSHKSLAQIVLGRRKGCREARVLLRKERVLLHKASVLLPDEEVERPAPRRRRPRRNRG